MTTTAASLRRAYNSSLEALVEACAANDADRAVSLLYSTRDLVAAMSARDGEEAARKLRATLIDLRIQKRLPTKVAKVA